jgi:histone acetyltransferase MYST1
MSSLQIGAHVSWRVRPGQILAIRGLMAYVRFDDCNRWLDLWVKLADLCASPPPRRISPKSVSCNCDDPQPVPAPIRNVDRIVFGRHSIACWYFSPYHESLTAGRELFVCDFCAMPFATKAAYLAHSHNPDERCPPGREIYRDDPLAVFEVSPRDFPFFCRCLQLLGRLFNEIVSEDYVIRYCHIYVLCEVDDRGAHIVGHFTRISEWQDPTVISRLVVLPPFQRRGLGGLMIAVAYEMAQRRGIVGGPSRPLGDLGRRAFRSDWAARISGILVERAEEIEGSNDIARMTGIRAADVRETLGVLGLAPPGGGELMPGVAATFARVGKVREMRIDFDPDLLEWFPEPVGEMEEESLSILLGGAPSLPDTQSGDE